MMWPEHQVHVEQGMKDRGVPLCTFFSTITGLHCMFGSMYASDALHKGKQFRFYCEWGLITGETLQYQVVEPHDLHWE